LQLNGREKLNLFVRLRHQVLSIHCKIQSRQEHFKLDVTISVDRNRPSHTLTSSVTPQVLRGTTTTLIISLFSAVCMVEGSKQQQAQHGTYFELHPYLQIA